MSAVSTNRKDPESSLFGRYSGALFRRISERLSCGIQEEYLRKLSSLSDEGARKDLNELVEKNTGFKRKRKKYALYSEASWRLVGVFWTR